jgi:hypothetical protein
MIILGGKAFLKAAEQQQHMKEVLIMAMNKISDMIMTQ